MNSIVHHIQTMSSIELVAIINDMRDPQAPELRHDNFMAKIESHPGIASPKFLGHALVTVGGGAQRKSKCYHLPKRECELMVMSESLAVQTKVYDRLAELEASQQIAAPARAPRIKAPVVAAAGMLPTLIRALRACGIDKNAAVLGANQIATKETGVNLLQLAGHTHIPTPSQQICFTPTELGKRFCKNAMTINRTLADAGLQERIGGHWVPTAKGRPHAVVMDTSKAHSSGTPIQQVKWTESVLQEVAL